MSNIDKTITIAVIIINNKLLCYKEKFLNENKDTFILPYVEVDDNDKTFNQIFKKYNINGEMIEQLLNYENDNIKFKPYIIDINKDILGLNEEQLIEIKDFDSIEWNPHFIYVINYIRRYFEKKSYVITKDIIFDNNEDMKKLVPVETVWEGICSEVDAIREFNKVVKGQLKEYYEDKTLKVWRNVCLYDEMGEIMKQYNL